MSVPPSARRKAPPIQARAEAKRTAILDAAERLLNRHDPSAITTRGVAEAADIPVGSVYRYFENVDDLLRRLFERMNAGTIQSLQDRLDEEASDWREHVRRTFDHLRTLHASHPAYGPLNAYLGAGTGKGADDAAIKVLLDQLMTRSLPDIDDSHRREIGRTMMAMIDGVERRLTRLSDADRDCALTEAQIAVTAYLAHYHAP